MTTAFFVCWIAILAFDGILIGGLTWAAESERFRKYRIRTPAREDIPPLKRRVNTGLNNVLSLVFFSAFFYYLGERTLYIGYPGAAHLLGEVLGVLLLYDFMYYFFHRAMHHPKLMRYVHGIHHFVRHTTSNKSVYLNPFETLGGLGLLLLAMVILGPISGISFLVVFLLYSAINIIVHSNLVIPHPAFRLFNFWTASHDIHHHKVRHNYASIFPFWDQMFGTHRTPGQV